MRCAAVKCALAYDSRSSLHVHPTDVSVERPQRTETTFRYLREQGYVERCLSVSPREATDVELLRVHTAAHIQHVASTTHADEPTLYANEHSALCARLAAGMTVEAMDMILQGTCQLAAAVVRPPGHHCHCDGSGGGFCLFNNVAIAVEHAVTVRGVQRVLIVDWDVHFGDGTYSKFFGRSDVLFISLHRRHTDAQSLTHTHVQINARVYACTHTDIHTHWRIPTCICPPGASFLVLAQAQRCVNHILAPLQPPCCP